MIGRPPRHTAFCVIATMGLVASNFSAGSAGRPEGPSFSLSAPTVTLAARCDLQFPIATVHIRAYNHGDAPSSPTNIRVLDNAHELAGSAELPQLAAHESRLIDIPLSLDPGFDPSKNPAALAGDHNIGVYLSNPQSPYTRLTSSAADVSTTIPTTFCAQATALGSFKSSSRTKAPGPSLAAGHTLFGSQAQTLLGQTSPVAASVVVPSANPTNGVPAVTAVRAEIAPLVAVTPLPTSIPPLSPGATRNPVALLIGAPPGLRAATNVGDCEAHLHGFSQIAGTASVAACESMISGGNLVLIWDAPADASVDGYRLYALVGVERGPAVATLSGRVRTLANLPPIASGPIPQCYVVTATYGSNESLAGPAYCARETAQTRTLGTTYTRFAWQDRAHQGGLSGFVPADPIPDGPVVGYYYTEKKSILGDSSYTKIHRYAAAFDLDSLRNKRLISARLHFAVQLSYGAGNNHSCATTVASGTEFWWKPDAASWIEGSFNDSAAQLSDTGPVVTADVTKAVAAIMAGSPNYGFVIRNDNENLDAFMNAQCETVYGDPQLDLVYYDR